MMLKIQYISITDIQGRLIYKKAYIDNIETAFEIKNPLEQNGLYIILISDGKSAKSFKLTNLNK
jgi:hypothetical protein